jgi:hypothetical protein
MRISTGSLLAAALAVLASDALAQTPAIEAEMADALSSGMRVRVHTTAGLRFTGRLLSTDESSLRLVDGRGLAIKLGRDQIAAVEVGMPRERGQGALRGAVKGGLVMAVAGGIALAADHGAKREDGLCGTLETGINPCLTGSDVAAATLGGALIGAGLGALFPGEKWHPLRTASLRLALGRTTSGGVGLRASLSF